jgi:secreted trypsin-like serine protease
MGKFHLGALAAAVAMLAAAPFAQAATAPGITPTISNTSDPANWRLTPGQSFNGVTGALDGVARLLFTTPQGNFICSGSLLAGGQYVLTAAHCADGFTSMTAEFGVVNDVAAVTRTVTGAVVHSGWNGSLDTGADIALVKLNQAVTTIQGFKLSTTNDIGKNYLMAGYGTTATGAGRSDPGWDEWGYAHYGYNTFDVDSSTFTAAWDAYSGEGVHTDPTYGVTYVSDFDPLSSVRNASRYNTLQVVADLTGGSWSSSAGLGTNEALIAGGDSGGGDYVWNGSAWELSGVHSWGWQFCQGRVDPSCDFRRRNSSSYGDLSGSTAVFDHVEWINSVITAVPEPGTWGMMALGMGMIGLSLRRRRG